MIEQKALVCAK